jgi:hypothetical protein
MLSYSSVTNVPNVKSSHWGAGRASAKLSIKRLTIGRGVGVNHTLIRHQNLHPKRLIRSMVWENVDCSAHPCSTAGVVIDHTPDAAVIVPPRATAVPSETAETKPTQRDRHLW